MQVVEHWLDAHKGCEEGVARNGLLEPMKCFFSVAQRRVIECELVLILSIVGYTTVFLFIFDDLLQITDDSLPRMTL
jgi:hypothetical protein